MRDPQAMSGAQVYPPPMPPCVCGHPYTAHRIHRTQRTSCTVHGRRPGCECRRYRPNEGSLTSDD